VTTTRLGGTEEKGECCATASKHWSASLKHGQGLSDI